MYLRVCITILLRECSVEEVEVMEAPVAGLDCRGDHRHVKLPCCDCTSKRDGFVFEGRFLRCPGGFRHWAVLSTHRLAWVN